MSSLQPISTAPRDQFILVACQSGYTTTPTVFTTAIMRSGYKVGRWIDHANDDLTDGGLVPTHWMPLPTAAPQPAHAPRRPLTDEEIDARLDAVLRAAGSALRYYTMAKSRSDMRNAMRSALADSTSQEGGAA